MWHHRSSCDGVPHLEWCWSNLLTIETSEPERSVDSTTSTPPKRRRGHFRINEVCLRLIYDDAHWLSWEKIEAAAYSEVRSRRTFATVLRCGEHTGSAHIHRKDASGMETCFGELQRTMQFLFFKNLGGRSSLCVRAQMRACVLAGGGGGAKTF